MAVDQTRVLRAAGLVLIDTSVSDTSTFLAHTSTTGSVKVRAVLGHTLTDTIDTHIVFSAGVAIVASLIAGALDALAIDANFLEALAEAVTTADNKSSNASAIDARVHGTSVVVIAGVGIHGALGTLTSHADRLSTRVGGLAAHRSTHANTISAAIVLSASVTVITSLGIGSLHAFTVLANGSDTRVGAGTSKRSTFAGSASSAAIVDSTRVTIVTSGIRGRFVVAVTALRVTDTHEAGLLRAGDSESTNALTLTADIRTSAEAAIIARSISVHRVTLASLRIALTSNTDTVVLTLVGIFVDALTRTATGHLASIAFRAVLSGHTVRNTVLTNGSHALALHANVVVGTRITIIARTIDVLHIAGTSAGVASGSLARVFGGAANGVGADTLTSDTSIETGAKVSIIAEVSTRASRALTRGDITESSLTRIAAGAHLGFTSHADTSNASVIKSTRVTVFARTIHRDSIALASDSVTHILNASSSLRTSHRVGADASAINTDRGGTGVTIITRSAVSLRDAFTIATDGIETNVVTNANASSTHALTTSANIIQSALVSIIARIRVVSEDALTSNAGIIRAGVLVVTNATSTNTLTLDAGVIDSATVAIITGTVHNSVAASTFDAGGLETRVAVGAVERNSLADTSNTSIILSALITIITSTVVIKISDVTHTSHGVASGNLADLGSDTIASVGIITNALAISADISRSTGITIVATHGVIIMSAFTSSFNAAIRGTYKSIVAVDRNTLADTSGTTVKSSTRRTIITDGGVVDKGTFTGERIARIIGTRIVVIAHNSGVHASTILARAGSTQVTIVAGSANDRSLHASASNAGGRHARAGRSADNSGTLAGSRDRITTVVGSARVSIIASLSTEEGILTVTEAADRAVASGRRSADLRSTSALATSADIVDSTSVTIITSTIGVGRSADTSQRITSAGLTHIGVTTRLEFTHAHTIDALIVDSTTVVVTAQGLHRGRLAGASSGVTGVGHARVGVSRVAVLGSTSADALRVADVTLSARVTIIARTTGSNTAAFTSTRNTNVTSGANVIVVTRTVALQGRSQLARRRSLVANLIVASLRSTVANTGRSVHTDVVLAAGSLAEGTRATFTGHSATFLHTSIHREIIGLDASQDDDLTVTITISIGIDLVVGAHIGSSPQVTGRTLPVHLVFTTQRQLGEQVFTIGIGGSGLNGLIVTVQGSLDIGNTRLIGDLKTILIVIIEDSVTNGTAAVVDTRINGEIVGSRRQQLTHIRPQISSKVGINSNVASRETRGQNGLVGERNDLDLVLSVGGGILVDREVVEDVTTSGTSGISGQHGGMIIRMVQLKSDSLNTQSVILNTVLVVIQEHIVTNGSIKVQTHIHVQASLTSGQRIIHKGALIEDVTVEKHDVGSGELVARRTIESHSVGGSKQVVEKIQTVLVGSGGSENSATDLQDSRHARNTQLERVLDVVASVIMPHVVTQSTRGNDGSVTETQFSNSSRGDVLEDQSVDTIGTRRSDRLSRSHTPGVGALGHRGFTRALEDDAGVLTADAQQNQSLQTKSRREVHGQGVRGRSGLAHSENLAVASLSTKGIGIRESVTSIRTGGRVHNIQVDRTTGRETEAPTVEVVGVERSGRKRVTILIDLPIQGTNTITFAIHTKIIEGTFDAIVTRHIHQAALIAANSVNFLINQVQLTLFVTSDDTITADGDALADVGVQVPSRALGRAVDGADTAVSGRPVAITSTRTHTIGCVDGSTGSGVSALIQSQLANTATFFITVVFRAVASTVIQLGFTDTITNKVTELRIKTAVLTVFTHPEVQALASALRFTVVHAVEDGTLALVDITVSIGSRDRTTVAVLAIPTIGTVALTVDKVLFSMDALGTILLRLTNGTVLGVVVSTNALAALARTSDLTIIGTEETTLSTLAFSSPVVRAGTGSTVGRGTGATVLATNVTGSTRFTRPLIGVTKTSVAVAIGVVDGTTVVTIASRSGVASQTIGCSVPTGLAVASVAVGVGSTMRVTVVHTLFALGIIGSIIRIVTFTRSTVGIQTTMIGTLSGIVVLSSTTVIANIASGSGPEVIADASTAIGVGLSVDAVESARFAVVASPSIFAVARVAQGLVLGGSTVLTNTSHTLLAVCTSEVGGAVTFAGAQVHLTIIATLVRIASFAVSSRPESIGGVTGAETARICSSGRTATVAVKIALVAAGALPIGVANAVLAVGAIEMTVVAVGAGSHRAGFAVGTDPLVSANATITAAVETSGVGVVAGVAAGLTIVTSPLSSIGVGAGATSASSIGTTTATATQATVLAQGTGAVVSIARTAAAVRIRGTTTIANSAGGTVQTIGSGIIVLAGTSTASARD